MPCRVLRHLSTPRAPVLEYASPEDRVGEVRDIKSATMRFQQAPDRTAIWCRSIGVAYTLTSDEACQAESYCFMRPLLEIVPAWHSLSIFKLRRVVLVCDTPQLAV